MGQKPTSGDKQNPGNGHTATNGQNSHTSPTATENGGRRQGETQGTKPNEQIPKLVSVEVPGSEDTTEQPKKGRGRPKGSTKKKSATPKKADTQNLKLLLLTVSGMVAARPGMEVWAMTPQEVEQIAEPLAAIMARHNVTEVTGEYADYIALVMACFIIFAPKYMMYKATKPKKEKKSNVQPIRQQQQQPGTNGQTEATRAPSEQVKRTPPASRPGTSAHLHSVIPATI